MTEKTLPVLSCEGCGVCCLHMGYPAFNFPLEEQLNDNVDSSELDSQDFDSLSVADRDRVRWNQMSTELKNSLVSFIRDYATPENGLDAACVWFDPATRLCKHHLDRPQVCRDFETGSSKCLEWRDAYREKIDLTDPR